MAGVGLAGIDAPLSGLHLVAEGGRRLVQVYPFLLYRLVVAENPHQHVGIIQVGADGEMDGFAHFRCRTAALHIQSFEDGEIVAVAADGEEDEFLFHAAAECVGGGQDDFVRSAGLLLQFGQHQQRVVGQGERAL